MDRTAFALMGPTATGKSAIALRLAEEFPFEIISVDSAQVYRGMDVGTAKVDVKAREEVRHHLIDIRDPDQPYSVAEFCADACSAANEIVGRGKIPLLVGGTMLYFKGLIEGISELPSADEEVRRELNERAASEGWAVLHAELGAIDPESARQIHENDPQRIQRALEIYRLTGRTMTALKNEPSNATRFPFELCQIGLVAQDRQVLSRRIEERFHDMLARGLVAELETLLSQYRLNGDEPAMKAVGYRQVWRHLREGMSHEEMVRQAVSATRGLAKRQMTWLRGWPQLERVQSDAPDPFERVLKIVCSRDIVDSPTG